MQLTKQEFKEDMLRVLDIDEESFDRTLVILPVNEGIYGDIGWVVIPNDPVRIMVHKRMYNESVDKLQRETTTNCRKCSPEATKEVALGSQVLQYKN